MQDVVSRLRGIVTALNTPFTVDDRVDLDALAANIKIALDAGVTGFLIPAKAGEVDKLSPYERELVVKTTVETVGGQVPVIGGASSLDAHERELIARTLIDLGCEGILASIPYTDDHDYERHVRALAGLRPGFLMLQDWEFQGYGLPVRLIAHLFDVIEAFQSIKIEVAPAGVKYTEVLKATDGELHIAGGWAVAQMIEALDRGVHTLIPTAMHHLYTRIYELYMKGDRTGAQALFYKMVPVLAFSNQHLDISVHFFKRLLWRQGVYRTPRVRPLVLPFDAVHERIADELIQYVTELMQSLEKNIREVKSSEGQ